MKTRLISALFFVLILAVAFILKFYVSNYFFDIIILIIATVSAYEMSRIFTKMNKNNDKYMATIFPCMLMLAYILSISSQDKLGLLYTIIIGFAIMLAFTLISFVIPFVTYKKTKRELKVRKMEDNSIVKYSFDKAINTLLVFIYPSFLITFMTFINHFEDMSNVFAGLTNFGGYISLFVLLMTLLIPIFTDTFAYLTGGLIGGKKLAPSISPKKTISGAVGGLLWCVLLSVTVFCIFNSFPVMADYFARAGINIWKIVIISFIGSILGQCGDLFESLLKRWANVKDSGNIMPGHGGMLDRFDSHMLVTPFVFIAFSIIFLMI